MTNRKTNFKK